MVRHFAILLVINFWDVAKEEIIKYRKQDAYGTIKKVSKNLNIVPLGAYAIRPYASNNYVKKS